MIIGTFSNISSANDKKVGIFYDERFLLHDTGPNHPENPDRLIPVIRDLKKNDQILCYLIFLISLCRILIIKKVDLYLKRLQKKLRVKI